MRYRVGRGLFGSLLAALCLLAAPSLGAAATNHPFLGTLSGAKIGQFEQFNDACGVATDSAGDIYVADYFGNRVAVFNADEEFLTQIRDIAPPETGGVAPIGGPCGLAVDSVGRVYINEFHRGVISYAPSAFPPTKSTTYGAPTTIDPNNATGVAVDPANDDVYVDERTAIAVFEPSGAPAPGETGEPLRIGAGLGGIRDGYGVAVSGFAGTAGRVYVADAATQTLQAYEPAVDPSEPVETISGAGTPSGEFAALSNSGLAVDPGDGHLYLTVNLQPGFETPEAIVYEFSAQGRYRGQLPHTPVEGEPSFLRAAEPSGVAIAPSGLIYVSSGAAEDAVVFIFGPAPPIPTRVLAVTELGSGSGTVTSSPEGLICPGACEGEFDQGSSVTVVAHPARGSVFAGWSGCEVEPSPGSCTMSMSSDRTLSGRFEPAPQKTLQVAVSGAGTVLSSPSGIECSGTCADDFDDGSVVTLVAAPARGSRFVRWNGCDEEPEQGGCRIAMSADRAVVAVFEAAPEEGDDLNSPPPRPPLPSVSPLTLTARPVLRAIGPVKVHGSSATLRLVVPAPGELTASGPGLRKSDGLMLRAGQANLAIRLSRRGERALRRAKHHRFTIKISLGFVAFDEEPEQRASTMVVFTTPRPTSKSKGKG
jgi:DNA-binding beta-propeller fold protein YncE